MLPSFYWLQASVKMTLTRPFSGNSALSSCIFSGFILLWVQLYFFPICIHKVASIWKWPQVTALLKSRHQGSPEGFRLFSPADSWRMSVQRGTFCTRSHTDHWAPTSSWLNLNTAVEVMGCCEKALGSTCFPVPDPEGRHSTREKPPPA